MNGKWIWFQDAVSTENERGCFVDNIYMEYKAEKVFLTISADTRYIVYVNGKEIGRGPIRSTIDHWYFDKYDITLCLRLGNNHLAVRVWNYGWSTYQSLASAGGLIFDVMQGKKVLASSGEQTKSARDLGHKYNTVKRNVNLGFSDFYDARKFDSRWVEEPYIARQWAGSKVIPDIWGNLYARPIKPFHSEVKLPQRIVEYSEVSKGCQQVSINTRKAFFGDRKDANETIFAGFIGCVIETSKDMEGYIAFPNRTWNGIIGDFKLNGDFYAVSNSQRDISVRLKRGRQLFLLQVSGKYDDLYCHMEFKFPEKIYFKAPFGDGISAFFVIGPTVRILPNIDGYDKVYGGLEEFNRLHEYTDLHHEVFASEDVNRLRKHKPHIKYIRPEYVFFDEYIYSLIKNEAKVNNFALTDQLSGMLWNNDIATVISKPVSENDRRIIVDFGDIFVGSLEFDLKASEGTILDVYCFENMFEGKIDYTVGLNNSVRYVCREGYQSYCCMTRMGGRFAAITLKNQTDDIEIHSFRMLHSTYATANMGSFRSSDALLNKIWDISKQTHLLCMEDSFTDCPTYEQAYWVGDAQISVYVNAYLYGEYSFIRHNLRLAVTALKNTPLMNALTPTDWDVSIPMWMMNWILSIEFYLEITGDKEIIKELYPGIRKTLSYYAEFVDAEGAFLLHAWNMLDWAAMDIHNHGVVTGQQAILAYCYKLSENYANNLGFVQDAREFSEIRQRLLQYIDHSLWDADQKVYLDGWSPEYGYSKTVSIQTHSLLVLYDAIVDNEKQNLTQQYLLNPPNDFLDVGSPFILFYLYEVWAKSGRTSRIFKDMKTRWNNMLRYDSTTCWEVFPGFYDVNRTRSYCHSWSSSPVYFLNRYVLGVGIGENNFRKIVVSVPDMDLEWCEGSIPTPHGVIHVRWSRENNNKFYWIAVPPEIEVIADQGFDWDISIEKFDA